MFTYPSTPEEATRLAGLEVLLGLQIVQVTLKMNRKRGL